MAVLSGITIAVHQLEAMRAFYAATLGIEWQEVKLAPGVKILRAALGDLQIQLCPASVAGVAAADFRHQLRFTVAELAAALAEGIDQGGAQQGEVLEQADFRHATLRDPDGNLLELIAAR